MRPVIEGIPQSVWHGCRPRLKLGERFSIARAKLFRHAVGPHGAPLVMITFEPDLEQIPEASILGDVARREMIVVV